MRTWAAKPQNHLQEDSVFMSQQIIFLLQQSLHYIHEVNFESAALLLKQILKIQPNHFEALRLMAVIAAQMGRNDEALELIEKSLKANKRNGISHSNKGNILLNLGHPQEAIRSFHKAIELAPRYSEAHGNLGNALQYIWDFEGAIQSYCDAIKLDPNNPSFYCHMGNAFLAMGDAEKARKSYLQAIQLDPHHADSNYYLSLLSLYQFNFYEGWRGNEWRWFSNGSNSPILNSSKPRWDGNYIPGTLFIWSEQGIGDQILYSSMLKEVYAYADSVIVSLDGKLLPLFRRSFPEYQFTDKAHLLPEDQYDGHIPIGSLGQFFRQDINEFKVDQNQYILADQHLTSQIRLSESFTQKITCGLSWKSSSRVRGKNKSMHLEDFEPLFALANKINFVNLQYGDTNDERLTIREKYRVDILNISNIDLFDDIDGIYSLIDACNIVITTSNTTAHMAGSIGKETILLLPYSAGTLWYWHDQDGFSPWYPSIKIFKQSKQGDWSQPVIEAKVYLEKRFAI